jgi:hypothetical protein
MFGSGKIEKGETGEEKELAGVRRQKLGFSIGPI